MAVEKSMICDSCVHLPSIKTYIKDHGIFSACNFCSAENILCIESKRLFEFVVERLEECLVPAQDLSYYDQMMIFECGADEPAIFPAWEFLEDHLDLGGEELVEVIVDNLPEKYLNSEGSHGPLFALNDGTLEDNNEFSFKWKDFVRSIRHEHRFFNQGAREFLDLLFEPVCIGGKLDEGLIKSFEISTELYRARIANCKKDIFEIEKDPKRQLGPVPADLAKNQRMTPTGIPSMYCAFDRDTCLSEIRAIVGDLVISGQFKPSEKLRLLNIASLKEKCSFEVDPLDVKYKHYSHVKVFLEEMVYELSRPLGRQDDLGYLSTQVFFEYLRILFADEVDGVLFTSVQTDEVGTNIALFPESFSKLTYEEKTLVFHKITSVKTESLDRSDSVLHTIDRHTLKRLGLL